MTVSIGAEVLAVVFLDVVHFVGGVAAGAATPHRMGVRLEAHIRPGLGSDHPAQGVDPRVGPSVHAHGGGQGRCERTGKDEARRAESFTARPAPGGRGCGATCEQRARRQGAPGGPAALAGGGQRRGVQRRRCAEGGGCLQREGRPRACQAEVARGAEETGPGTQLSGEGKVALARRGSLSPRCPGRSRWGSSGREPGCGGWW